MAHDGQSRVVSLLCVLKGGAAKGLSYLLSKVKVCILDPSARYPYRKGCSYGTVVIEPATQSML